MKKLAILLVALISGIGFAPAQDSIGKPKDTLKISLQELELMFLKKNYQLLAQKYNIDMAGAAVQQARLWYNPYFFYENVLYYPIEHNFFNNSYNGGERIAQVSQLISLGGKRSKLVKLAETNKQLEVYAFHDLLRELRFQLISDYSLIFADLQKLALLKQELSKLQFLVEIFKRQYKEGTISGYELTRVEFEAQTVQANILQIVNELFETQSRVRLMVQSGPEIFIKPISLPLKDSILFQYALVLDSALLNRPDLKVADTQIEYSKRSLILEKSRAIPNLTVGANYERLGGAFRNYSGVNAAFDLPVFNRNQGNIKRAEIYLENSKAGAEYSKLQVYQEVDEACLKLNSAKNTASSIDPAYKTNLVSIGDEAIKNYNLRVISLLDFMDKMKTYKNGQLTLIDITANYFMAQQYLNYVSNTLFY